MSLTYVLGNFSLLEVMSPERRGYGEVGGKERWLMYSRMFSHRKPRGGEKFQARIFAAGFLSPQFWGEDLAHVFRSQIVRWGLPCGSSIGAPAVLRVCCVLWKTRAPCYYMEIRSNIFLPTKCFVHWISNLTGREAISVVAGSYFLLLQRNTTIQSFTCMTISLLSKEI